MTNVKLWIVNEAELKSVAAALAPLAAGLVAISLEGPLGAGKTTFARHFARALGVAAPVASPTFTLQRIYPVPGGGPVERLVHYDWYRLSGPDDLRELGFGDMGDGALEIVEWGDRFADRLPAGTLRVSLFPGEHGPEAPARRLDFRFAEASQASRFRSALGGVAVIG